MPALARAAVAEDLTGTPQRPIASLADLAAAEAECRRCPLYQFATQVVPGEGPRDARMLLVGEQPGDQEDRAGRPFVGPAGRVLDRALAEAGISRETTFVTNAVKHFKHEMRGKRRLHKRPNAYEIDACRWWLDRERTLLQPQVIVALGATGLRGVLGRPATITSLRGKPVDLEDGVRLVATIHPSALLRMDDEAAKREAYAAFVADLRLGASLLDGKHPASTTAARRSVRNAAPAPVTGRARPSRRGVVPPIATGSKRRRSA
jgi:uracil-DNA glycosylase family protein